MWEFARSVLSFSWAMSLFGFQQAASLLTPSQAAKASKAFDDMTAAAEAELDGPLKATFRTWDAWLETVTGGAASGETLPRNSSPGGVVRPNQYRMPACDMASFRSADSGTQLSTTPRSTTPLASPSFSAAPEIKGWGPMPATQTTQAAVESFAEPDISADYPFESHYAEVFGQRMHYIEEGVGDPILLLHGNPTWSYIWRNIIPYLSPLGRCIAPDLIGYGRSAKPDIEYRWFDHVRYLEEFIDRLGLRNITLVLHDHGSGLGFHYAMQHEQNIRGIAFLEAIVRPYRWEQFSSPEFREIFRRFRAGGVGGEGWQLLVEQNMFIEQLLPQASARPLAEKEMDFYREPFRNPASRLPIWRLARETPIGGEPPEVWDAVTAYSERLQRSELPKLMLYFTPGALLTAEHVEWCRRNIKNLASVNVGQGVHFVQESSPRRIGAEISRWVRGLQIAESAK